MLVFIDDSGDAGFKLTKGSSKFFVIAAVIFNDPLEAEKTAVAIKEARRAMGFPDDVEFKFNKSRKDVRVKFFNAVKEFDFRIRAIVVDKSIIRSTELKADDEKFLAFIIKSLLRYNNSTIKDASIKIDGSGGREFRKLFLDYLKRELNRGSCRTFKRCKLVDSKSNVLIQLADMVAGAIRVSYEDGRTDDKLYKKIFKKKIEDEWKFK